jgi:flagellar biosynthesis protein FlhA
MRFVMPAVRILDDVRLEANTYIIKIKEVDAGRAKIWPNQFKVMESGGGRSWCPASTPPSRRLACRPPWIDASLKREAALQGYTVVDATTVLSTHP